MLPPFVPTAKPLNRGTRSEAGLLPPLRLGAERQLERPTGGPPPVEPQAAELPWMVEPQLEEGQVDEYAPPYDAQAAGDAESSFRALDLSDEWETDQLAALDGDDDEEIGTTLSPTPVATDTEDAAPVPIADVAELRDWMIGVELDSPEPAEDAFESDAEMFVKLLDELEASARAEAAKLDQGEPEPRRPPAPPGELARSSEAQRVEEIATRLERIARSLRERGPAGPLADEGGDPLGAMVAGYLLGLSERTLHDDPLGGEE